MNEEKITGTLWIAAVKADKAGGWSSVEDEAAALLPLLFLEQRIKTVGEGEDADYVAEIILREREFSRGWKNTASLAVELRLWPAKAGVRETLVPLAAGQVLLQGEDSLSSSKTLGRLLRKAVERAVKALQKTQKIDTPQEAGKAAAIS